jgi:dTDP-4-dehydrorhamnose reductase
LAQQHIDSNTKLIHLSTDCVFSGASGGYTEDSLTDGKTMYDRSKALGEVINDKDLTFRMSIIGPDISIDGVGLFNWFMKQHGRIHGYTKAIWNGITTIELAKAISAAINQNLIGLYHLTPNENISKYNLLHLFKKEFGKEDVEIIPYDNFVVDKTLINTRTDFDYQIPTYPEMIHEMALWIQQHKRLYHYE